MSIFAVLVSYVCKYLYGVFVYQCAISMYVIVCFCVFGMFCTTSKRVSADYLYQVRTVLVQV